MDPVSPQITAVTLAPDGVEISYLHFPQDVRKNGLVWTRTVLVPFGSDYDDEIETFLDGLRALLLDALDDEDRAEPIDLEEEEDDEDE